jgi:DNA-binding HxlR family transcriptional regulator
MFAAMPKSHPPANIFSSQCPSRRVLTVLAEKWTLLVVSRLAAGPLRTAEIRRSVDGISEKMLIQTLRKLEAFALVSRRSYPQVPPRVEYRLTPLGRSLARLTGLFGRWVERNVPALLKAEEEGRAA